MYPESPDPAHVAEKETETQSNCSRFLHKDGAELRLEPRRFNFNWVHFLLPPLLAARGSSIPLVMFHLGVGGLGCDPPEAEVIPYFTSLHTCTQCKTILSEAKSLGGGQCGREQHPSCCSSSSGLKERVEAERAVRHLNRRWHGLPKGQFS